MNIIYSLFFFLLSTFFNIAFCSTKLRFVFSMFRHGARAPYTLNKETNIDLFGNKWESESKLTSVGIRQHYLNGYKNKQKYFSQLNITNQNYNPNEIVFYSTDTERTIMSAYSQIFGMFPPGTGPKLNENDDFQSKIAVPPMNLFNFSKVESSLQYSALGANVNLFPVKLFDMTANYFNLNDPAICPKVQLYQDENEKNKEYQSFLVNFRTKYQDRILRIINKTDNPEFLNRAWNPT